jgi:hypothetical protein
MIRKLLIALVSAAVIAGCETAPPQPNPNAAPRSKIVQGPIRMPAGVDFGRLQLVDEARLIRVYTQMTGIGDAKDDKLLFPRAVAEKIGLTNRQVNRRFMDMILASRRFQVFDDSTTVVRENALQTIEGKPMDIVINGEVVGSTQDIIPIAPYRKARTTVRLSVQMMDVMSGEQLFPAGVSVVGDYGMTQGEGTMIPPSASTSSPEMQLSLANDYQRALDKTLEGAVARIGKVLRPMGRVTFADAKSVSIIGGSRHGFQGGDVLIVFHADTTQLGQRTVIARTQPLAVVRCDGVGTETSQCDIIQLDPTMKPPAAGDYAVLSDTSALGVREE